MPDDGVILGYAAGTRRAEVAADNDGLGWGAQRGGHSQERCPSKGSGAIGRHFQYRDNRGVLGQQS